MNALLSFIADHWLLFALSGASVLLAAFFAASETAIVFANKARLREMAEAGNPRAGVVLSLLEKRGGLHSTLLLAENFFIVLAAALGTVTAMHLFAETTIAGIVSKAVSSVIVVLVSKLAPKGLAARNPDRLSLLVAFPMRFVMRLISPAARVLAAAADFFVGPGPQGMSCTAVVTEEDIKAMINLGEEGGSLKEEEKELLHKVFEFGDTLASEAMRPRTEIVSVPSNSTLQDVFSLVSEFGYSRYPVIEDTIDAVVGILYVKDILVAMSAGEVKREDGIQRFIRPAYFIPENKRVSELLAEMQRERFQIAIVIDEYGGASGLVTLADLMEENVGRSHYELGVTGEKVGMCDE